MSVKIPLYWSNNFLLGKLGINIMAGSGLTVDISYAEGLYPAQAKLALSDKCMFC